MRSILCLLLLAIPISIKAEVFRCDEMRGVTMRSTDGYKEIIPDGISGLLPIVVVDDKEITISESRSSGITEKLWKGVVLRRSPESISGVAVDSGPSISEVVLFTVDVKQGYLYFSSHKDYKFRDLSYISSFVSKCSK
jgi:hypothetical protein